MKIHVKFLNKIIEVDDSCISRYFPKFSVEGRHKVDTGLLTLSDLFYYDKLLVFHHQLFYVVEVSKYL